MGKIIKVKGIEVAEDKPEEPWIAISKEFENLLEPLTEKELKDLTESILEEGCRQPIYIWGDKIIDGHNRYKICCEHDIHFETRQKQFKNKEYAKLWILKNQIGRRNLSDVQRMNIALKTKNLEKKISKENSLKKNFDCSLENSQNETLKEKEKKWNENRTDARLAKLANVSTAKMFRYQEILEKGTPEEIKKVKIEEDKIFPTYNKIIRRKRVSIAKKGFPKSKYRVVYANCDFMNNQIFSGSVDADIKYVKKIPVREFLDKKAVAFIWTSLYYIDTAIEIMKAWGFEYKTMFILEEKDSSPSVFHLNSMDHRVVLVGRKPGCFIRPDKKNLYSSKIDTTSERINHEEYFRHVMEKMFPDGNKIQLFIE